MKIWKKYGEPSLDDNYFKHINSGGFNRCIEIKNGDCLPNCVGYAWGMLLKQNGAHSLPRVNAERWYSWSHGYKTGQDPKVGAVACWKKGNVTAKGEDGAGHVAVVEEVYKDGSILISASDYGGKRWYQKKLEKGYKLKGLDFQGFIYVNDFYIEDNNENCEEWLKGAALDVIAGKFGNGEERKELLYKAIQNKVNEVLKNGK